MDTKITNPVTRATRRYFWEFGGAMVGYVVVILVSRWLLRDVVPGGEREGRWWEVGIALLPVLPLVVIFVAVVRLLVATDEMYRRVCVTSLAVAGGVTALLAATYGLMEGERFKPLSAWWTYGVFMGVWLVATFFVRRRYR